MMHGAVMKEEVAVEIPPQAAPGQGTSAARTAGMCREGSELYQNTSPRGIWW